MRRTVRTVVEKARSLGLDAQIWQPDRNYRIVFLRQGMQVGGVYLTLSEAVAFLEGYDYGKGVIE